RAERIVSQPDERAARETARQHERAPWRVARTEPAGNPRREREAGGKLAIPLHADVHPEERAPGRPRKAPDRRGVRILPEVARAHQVGAGDEHAEWLPGEAPAVPPEMVERARREDVRVRLAEDGDL